MTSALHSKPLSFASIDDYLGPRTHRFFGEGHKRSTHQLDDVEITSSASSGHGGLKATARVDYPPDWSRKGETMQGAHLSTIDVLLLGEQITAIYLAHAFDSGELQPVLLAPVRIIAGSSAIEDELDGFEISATAVSTPAPHSTDSIHTRLSCEIGTLRLSWVVEHLPLHQRSGRWRYSNATHSLTREWVGSIKSGSRGRSQLLRQVSADLSSLTAQADVTLIGPTATPDRVGRPTDLLVDCFAESLQLGQLLLYELDGVSRRLSNTLWMRQTSFRWQRDHVPNETKATARLEKARLLDRREGRERWRTADIVGTAHGVEMRCAVAHLLP